MWSRYTPNIRLMIYDSFDTACQPSNVSPWRCAVEISWSQISLTSKVFLKRFGIYLHRSLIMPAVMPLQEMRLKHHPVHKPKHQSLMPTPPNTQMMCAGVAVQSFLVRKSTHMELKKIYITEILITPWIDEADFAHERFTAQYRRAFSLSCCNMT